jgi:signal transduction histidine kinase/DNA-binding response OmpR family regulator/ligand-binding sensor domain-containing protein/HPt (histidine-containing phosphotransfer) domain-containing protein
MQRKSQKQFRRPCYFALLVVLCCAALYATRAMLEAANAAPKGRPAEARDVDPVGAGRVAFSHFTDRDGLPQNAIQAMAFDHKGYLWVGTQDGAAYYNGRVWTVLNMPNRTVSNFVRSILVASDESIWFGRQEGGVSRFKNGDWTSFDEKSVLPDKRVNALLETRTADGTQVIWVGTDRGLARLDGDQWTSFDARNGLPDDRVTSLFETKERDGTSIVWVGTDKGLARFHRGEWRIFDKRDGLLHERINSLLATTEANGLNVLWTGTSDGIERFSLDENRWTTLETGAGAPASTVVCLAQTVEPNGERVLWAGMDGGGLARLQSGNWTTFGTREGLSSNSVFSLLQSAGSGGTETLWIGTDGGGLARLPMSGWRSFTSANGLPASSVYCIFETMEPDGRAMWFGTYGAGLARLQNGVWTIFDKSSGMPDNTVFEMLETTLDDGQRVLWAGTKGGGLAHFENGRWVKGEIEKAFGESTVRNMLATTDEAGSRVVWVASGSRGLGRLYKNKWTFFDTTNGLPHKSVFEMAETIDADGTHVLWVATGGGGVARYAKNQWKVFDTSTGLPTNSVLSLHVSRTPDGRQYLWAGTEGGGVSRLELNRDDEVAHWVTYSDTTTPGLPNNTIYQIREDARGRIYLSHNKGITRLTPRSAPADDATAANAVEYDVYTFTTEDGLPSNEGNGGVSLIDSRGRIWFGTVGGAAVFDPAQEISDQTVKPLYIEHTLINGETRTLAGGQSLTHNENHLTFEYALLSFAHEDGTHYRTQLVGLEKAPSAWTVDTKKDFTALPPGDYTFKVWGKDDAGNVTQPAIVSFTIKPALWRTWWAYTLYAGLLLGLTIIGVRYRTKSLVRRNALLQAKVDERTHELAEKVEQLKESEQRAYDYAQAKSQFLANMSHEIRTPINGVIGMTSLLLDTPLTREQRERADLVKRSGDMLLTIINDILDFSKIEAGKLELETIDFELATAIEDALELVARKAQSKSLELASFIAPDVPQVLRGDPIRLRQILINLVDNAIKFTEQGEVSVCVQLVEAASDNIVLRYEVCDTGIGVPPEALNNLFLPFTQADSSTTRKYGGTGLGLTIAKQLVELMEGQVGAESKPGEGSMFWFTACFARASSIPSALLSGQGALHGRRALYIGAPGTHRDSVLAQLAAWKIDATAVDDGASALTTLEHDALAFDLLIVDSSLGDMDGHTLAQTIRYEPATSNVPVILLTPLAEQRDMRGDFQLLTKPVRRAQFYAQLCAALHLIEGQASAVSISHASSTSDGNGTGDSLAGETAIFVEAHNSNRPLKDFRLLLVEDNQTNQQVAVSTLAQMGYRIESVANGREAIAALRESDYDLVFMDCHMPEMDGFEATAEIRRHEPATRRTPIIAMTASALPEDRARCLAIGMDDYLTKPLHREELRAVLERWLHGTGRDTEPDVVRWHAPGSFESGPLEPQALLDLRQLGGPNQSFLGELIDLFLQESDKRLASMREAARRKDMSALHHLAHTQRGACLNFGAQQMARHCAELENINSSHTEAATGEITEVVAHIEQEFLRVRRALEQARLTALADL